MEEEFAIGEKNCNQVLTMVEEQKKSWNPRMTSSYLNLFFKWRNIISIFLLKSSL